MVYVILWSILPMGIGILLCTVYVFVRTARFEKVHKEYAKDCAKLCKALEE